MYVSVRLCLRLRVRMRCGHEVCHTSKLLHSALEHLICGLNAVRFLDFFEYLLTHSLHARIRFPLKGDIVVWRQHSMHTALEHICILEDGDS